MKKLGISLFMLLLFSSISAFAARVPDEVKVGLKYAETAVSSIPVKCKGGAVITDEGGSELYRQDGALDMIVKAENKTAISVYIGDKAVVTFEGDIYIAPIEGMITLDNYTYRGKLLFKRINGAPLTVINQLKMDEYLYGVVPREIGGNSHIEALKAQAICARSYAASNIGRHKSDGFDFCFGQHCQVYGNISGETANANRAVDETHGIVGTYNGRIAEMFFFASSGGHTENVENVWITPIPYLIGVEDSYETDKATRHTWSVTLTDEEVSELFNKYNIGRVKDIKILEKTNAGSVLRLEVIGEQGSKIFEREGCRTAFGGKLYSQSYDIQKNIEGSSNTYTAIGSNSHNKLGSNIYVIGAEGISQKQLNGINVLSSEGSSSLIVTEGRVTSYTFNGRGWGHRVGMSQWGAIAMAESGFTYEQILKHYYTGIQLEKLQ